MAITNQSSKAKGDRADRKKTCLLIRSTIQINLQSLTAVILSLEVNIVMTYINFWLTSTFLSTVSNKSELNNLNLQKIHSDELNELKFSLVNSTTKISAAICIYHHLIILMPCDNSF